ncbi:type VI secretion system baseplate subunit TssE [Aquabacterium sp. A7-Y]|uniref:type VI secretion system baseplate subunit TssE n=1 Tax=Aquabacterium sp. A7-Y TaxID=1349605 RepID=UPI00223D632C|nr:type VI secretion system baseplate subunit TssE [Aquabacterium sp. A7-Y]MCW7540748.1 type VI secretion system baseplate subunit TssE [Aquabacterium sp. A7-Y]
MAELTPQERLQPALLDRLTDDDPSKTVEPRELRVLSKSRLREAVLRDLAWLFNSTRMSGHTDWQSLPHAERSVVNFGLPALSGETASTLDIVNLEADVKRAILDFEPRIMAASLKVEALVSELQMDHHNVVSLRISGHLWAQPVPFELLLRTEVDLETGQVEIQELTR